MEEKKRTIVMFGDSLTDYFPMEKLKDNGLWICGTDIDAKRYGCAVH